MAIIGMKKIIRGERQELSARTGK